MNRFYESWLAIAKDAAHGAGLGWDPPYCVATGAVDKSARWDLTRLVGQSPPPTTWMSDFGHIINDLAILEGLPAGIGRRTSAVMSKEWRDFYQAVLVHELLIKRNKINQATANMGRPVRLISACAGTMPPWGLDAGTVQLAYNVALRVGGSGKTALNLKMVVRRLLDGQHLADNAPLNHYCVPYPDHASQDAEKRVARQKAREGSNFNVHAIRARLSDRKSAEKLPEAIAPARSMSE